MLPDVLVMVTVVRSKVPLTVSTPKLPLDTPFVLLLEKVTEAPVGISTLLMLNVRLITKVTVPPIMASFCEMLAALVPKAIVSVAVPIMPSLKIFAPLLIKLKLEFTSSIPLIVVVLPPPGEVPPISVTLNIGLVPTPALAK
jgi:hypothetical protein